VQALFKKARRVARGRDELQAQLAMQTAELESTREALSRLEAKPERAELEQLVERFAPSLKNTATGKAAPEDAARETKARHPSLPEGFTPRVYELPGGWIVWVGRNSKQNDELTHRQASQRDVWFHARGCQGSHTVLRVASGKGEPPRDILEAAAAIAAFHSKARNSKLVPVAYTEKRYVRKPRKAPVGTAVMMREKVIMVAPRVPEEASA
jgi:predicted ribosome quality control (RQC) complex YloA/Tae2 family protein